MRWLYLALTLPVVAQEIVPVLSPRAATVGVPFRAVYRSPGASPPYTWTATGLLPGLRLRPEGPRVYVEGVPTQEGTVEFNLLLTYGTGNILQRSVRLQLFRKIQFESEPRLPDATVGQDYQHRLRATSVTTATRFELTDGEFPLGTMNGEIWGKPSEPGSYRFVIRAVAYQDGIGFIEGNEAEQVFTLTVKGDDPASNCPAWPAGFRPFTSMAYVAPRGIGMSKVVLLVGSRTDAPDVTTGLPPIPLPETSDQYYCTSVEMAPGLWAKPALPTAAERVGDFHEYSGRLLDPATYQGGPFPSGMVPFPLGIIPPARLASTYAWRANGFDAPVTSLPGTLDAASYAPELTQGSWAVLFGKNLTVATRTWGDRDIVNGRLPAELAQTSILFYTTSQTQKSAALSYASPSQINFLVPNLDIPSDQPFTYTSLHHRNELWAGSRSAKVRRVAPKFYMLDEGARKYPAALHADGSVVAPAGLITGSQPARPGETLQLFCSSLGRTNPPAPENQLVPTPLPLANAEDFLVRIGGSPVPVQYAGLIAPGLYQVNVVVPSLPAGEHPIELEAEGYASPAGVVIAVQPR